MPDFVNCNGHFFAVQPILLRCNGRQLHGQICSQLEKMLNRCYSGLRASRNCLIENL
ncbi:hypothetical protein BQ8482_80109 [Mesorhizobium delmotii]|uniref:Uncharacterized protein n=1 Tax=Mesorhizobium delmotii TaxID=1631247 RepID=A0A2P9AWE4_9HYPH|nr:hypothetical protein BQ8482_80109 [Mesorhizobium delmotii]